MPGNLLFIDTSFPDVSGDDTKKDLKSVLNYLYMLREELRYTMSNIGVGNFNDTELVDLTGIVVGSLDIKIQTIEGSLSQIIGRADENEASLTMLSQFTGAAGVVTITSAGQMTDITKIYLLNGAYYIWNGTGWVVTAKPTSEAVASVQTQANATGAKVSLIASYTGQDSGLSEASFVLSAINGQSFAAMNADRINFAGFTTFMRPGDVGAYGTTTIDGGRILTGTVNANRIEAGAFVTSAGLSGGTTLISGACVRTGQISADYLGANSYPYMTFHAPLLLDSANPSISGIETLYFNANNKIERDAFGYLSISSAYGVRIVGDLNVQKIYNAGNISIDVPNGYSMFIGTYTGTAQNISIGNVNSAVHLVGDVYINGVLQ